MANRNYVLITIHPDGKVSKLVQAHEPKLEQLQKAVGGYLERVPYFTRLAIKEGERVFAYMRGNCWVDEEGKLPHKQYPLNPRATEMWKGQYGYVDQWLVGDVVFVARTSEECSTT